MLSITNNRLILIVFCLFLLFLFYASKNNKKNPANTQTIHSILEKRCFLVHLG